MSDEDDVIKSSLRALSNWVVESKRRGLAGNNLVAMLLSETVRNYKLHYRIPDDVHLVTWIRKTFNYKEDDGDDEDEWGTN